MASEPECSVPVWQISKGKVPFLEQGMCSMFRTSSDTIPSASPSDRSVPDL